MKIVFKAKDLERYLAVLSIAATFDLSSPRYSTVRIQTSPLSEDALIEVSDSTMYAAAEVPYTQGDEVGDMSVQTSLRLLANAARLAPGENVEMTVEKDRIKVKSGSMSVTMPLVKEFEVTAFPFNGPHSVVELSFAAMKDCLNRTSWLVEKRSVKPSFAGVHLVEGVFVSTNVSSIVAVNSPKTVANVDIPKDMGLPVRFVAGLSKFGLKDDDLVLLSCNEEGTMCQFQTERFRLTSPLLQGPLPDYKKVTKDPEQYRNMVVDRDEMADTLYRMNTIMLAENAKFTYAEFSFSGGECRVKSTTVPFDLTDSFSYVNDNFEVDDAFVYRMDTGVLEKGLRACPTESVNLLISQLPGKPVKITDKDSASYQYVTMPVR